MTWGGAEAAALMQTRKDEFQNLSAREGIRAPQQMQSRQSPIQSVESEVLGEPVLEFVFALRWSECSCAGSYGGKAHGVETLDVADVLVHVQLHIGGHGAYSAARSRNEGHVWGCGSGNNRWQRAEVRIEVLGFGA
jgi:hypothetical protein